MLILGYLLIAVLVIALSIKLSQYVDSIDKKTALSGAFVGAVFLSAVTSLPELFTTGSAIFLVGQPDLILGNILGSNIFNVTALCIIFLVTYKKFFAAKLSSGHIAVVICAILMYTLIGIVLVSGKDPMIFGISIISIGMVVLYVFSVRRLSQDTNVVEAEQDPLAHLSLRGIIFRFCILALILIGMSILLTYVTDLIATKYQMGVTLAGALLLGVATSLPEVSATIALSRIGNYDAMVGNIMGSNLFNFVILFVGDVLCVSRSLYHFNPQTVALVVFGLLNTFCVLWIIIQKQRNWLGNPLAKISFVVVNLAAVAFYVTFLAFPYS